MRSEGRPGSKQGSASQGDTNPALRRLWELAAFDHRRARHALTHRSYRHRHSPSALYHDALRERPGTVK